MSVEWSPFPLVTYIHADQVLSQDRNREEDNLFLK